ncbi:hypothetical protein RKE30_23035 [Streptomyces sp. Li-HN-5-11]|uniref:hypothetical protein n=1 Tax=Streptomyces sp. Li-HN-5-11 TaxID=3075432 RepID=UPI0028AEDC09|nr:hypothetical protein [Streptomyces sp. Li-HN-5-11]WNM33056.1 hypothetical protein RKE30_23035 [Streptomyces sp. Li-HN-5-11]
MTAHTTEKPVVQRSETGWAQARRLRRKGVRTCLPAIEDRTDPHEEHTGAEWNIVRGED